MIKVNKYKRVKIITIISVIVLIVLVWWVAWTNIVASERIIKQEKLIPEETIVDAQENVENVEEEYIQSEKEENIKIVKKDNLEEKNKSKETLPEEKVVEETISNKTISDFEDISEGDVYSVYNNALIIGDSRTEGFKIYAGVKNADYFCRKAMTIDEIVEGKQISIEGQNISVYDLLDEISYDKVLIGVGLNELGWNHIENFIENYGQLIDKIKEKQPDTTIYLQAVLPVSKYKNDNDNVHNNAQIYWYNENIIKLASDKGVKFVNPAAALVDADGCLVAEATADGIHLNSEYCKVWAKYLAGLV